jgi:gamma-glutamyltranspeptidase/glutathione hydrolase
LLKHLIRTLALLVVLSFGVVTGHARSADDLSPQHWPEAERVAAEQSEIAAPTPSVRRVVSGKSGLVVSTLSPIAALAGVQTLKHGGNAADAAIAAALTQIATALGTNISYAGILEVVYYDAKSRRTQTLGAGWNTWSGETDRASIPLSPTLSGLFGQLSVAKSAGRGTLVPGFMAGIEALHLRFGKRKFKDLFAPAIYYAEHGITLSPMLGGYFSAFSPFLAATPAGQRFMRQSGGDVPRRGDRFVQTDLAATLRTVARRGAREMYSGAWAREFVAAVAAAGGKASLEDMKRYHVEWSEPVSGQFQEYEIKLSPTTLGGPAILESLALAEHTGLVKEAPYSRDAASLLQLSRILSWSMIGANNPAALAPFKAAGIDVSLAGRLSPTYASAVGAALRNLFVAAPGPVAPTTTPHTASVTVVDAEGNVAVLIHTANTVGWGSTGLIVGGVPIPEAAGLTSLRFPTVKPGQRLPHDMAPLIVFKDGQPTLGMSTAGASFENETVKVLLETLAYGSDLTTALSAPPVLLSASEPQPGGAEVMTLQVPASAYSAELIANLRSQEIHIKECTPAEVNALKGTPAVVRIGHGRFESADVPGVFTFALGF